MAKDYRNAGAYYHQVEICDDDGTAATAPAVATIVAAFEPTAGGRVLATIAAQPDAPRNCTVTLTDADASITTYDVEITGTDSQDRAVQETISMTGSAGSGTIIGNQPFKTITTIYVSCTGVVDVGVDTIAVGDGYILGLPYEIVNASDITIRRVDASTGVGSISAAYNSWNVSASPPNAARQYFVSGQSDATAVK